MKNHLLWLFVFCAGCKVGPHYEPPENPVCDDWVVPQEDTQEPIAKWWTLFNDDELNHLVDLAVGFNYDLQVAEANVWRARALVQVAASELFPEISADFNATRISYSKNGQLLGLVSSLDPLTAPRIPQIQSIYNAAIDARWELDVFGKHRREVESQLATYESIIEQYHDVMISLIAEVGRNYVQLRSAQKNAALLANNVQLLEQNTDLLNRRLRSGLINNLDVQRIDAELAVARANIPPVIAQIYQSIYALSVLTGNTPEALLCELLPAEPLPTSPECVALGLRSDLLRRRPDIRRAERELAAATADIGVAVAEFFPTFTLRGSVGLQAMQMDKLFGPHSGTWYYTSDVRFPVFQGGGLVANLNATKAAALATWGEYKATVLDALNEAEGSLVAFTQQQIASQQLRDAVMKTRQVSELTNQRLVNGLVNLTDWLDSERQLISSEQNLLTAETNTLLNLISLYKALGGGWELCDEQSVQDCLLTNYSRE